MKVYFLYICPTCDEFISEAQIRATLDHYNSAGMVCQQKNGMPRRYIAYETSQK